MLDTNPTPTTTVPDRTNYGRAEELVRSGSNQTNVLVSGVTLAVLANVDATDRQTEALDRLAAAIEAANDDVDSPALSFGQYALVAALGAAAAAWWHLPVWLSVAGLGLAGGLLVVAGIAAYRAGTERRR